MQLIIKDGNVIATHEDSQVIAHLYPDTECIKWLEPFQLVSPLDGLTPDPRTEQQKKDKYKDKRRVEYPSVENQLDMLYNDTINGTTTWTDAIGNVKTEFPKPSLEV